MDYNVSLCPPPASQIQQPPSVHSGGTTPC